MASGCNFYSVIRQNAGESMQCIIMSRMKNGCTIFTLSGDLNYEGACRLRSAFNDAQAEGRKNFILNLEGLKVICSYSLSIIIKLFYSAKKSDGSLKVICPEGNVWDVFDVLELGKVIPVFSSEEMLWASDIQLS
jgi:anti-anti-sigma factor